MNVIAVLLFLPLRESVLKRLEPLGRWIEQWDSELGRSVETMDLEGCSDRGHDHDGGEDTIDGFWIHKFRSGTFIWIPSPGVDRIIIEKLHPAHHKNTKSAHVFVGPMLVWNKWWIDIHKSEDIILDVLVRSGYI